MNQPQHGFDEALISGYLDRELTQAEAQRVRLHLEDCAECRATATELAQLKEATMSSEFKIPDDGWDETPRGGASHLLRNAGLLVGGFLVSAGLILASVIIDRRRAMKNDKYTKVQK